jgi:hypothetical protein
MPEPDGAPLAGIVEEPGQEQVAVIGAERTEPFQHIQAMAPIGDGHAVEERQLGRRQPAGQPGPLSRRHAGDEVAAELADLRRPPGGE